MDFDVLGGVALVVLYNGDLELVGMGNEDFAMLLYIEIINILRTRSKCFSALIATAFPKQTTIFVPYTYLRALHVLYFFSFLVSTFLPFHDLIHSVIFIWIFWFTSFYLLYHTSYWLYIVLPPHLYPVYCLHGLTYNLVSILFLFVGSLSLLAPSCYSS